MKRIWIAFAVLTLILGLCVTEIFIVDNISNKLYDELNFAQEAINEENMETAKSINDRLENYWGNHYEALAMFIPHHRLESIDESFAVIEKNLENDESSDYLAESSRLKVLIKHLNDVETPTINNIF